MSIPNSAFMKGVGAFCIVVGLVEIGVGAEVWSYLDGVKYGSWWAAMIVVVSGVLGLVANNKMMVQVMTFFSTCASILCFAGMLTDSFGYRRTNALETCVNTETGEYNGASYLEPKASTCAAQTNDLCACVKSGGDDCHFFNINKYKQDNCELILTNYTDLLLVSLVFTTFCLAWVFLLSIIGCVTLSKIDAPATTNSPKPVSTFADEDVAAPAPVAAAPVGAVEMTSQPAATEEGPDSPI